MGPMGKGPWAQWAWAHGPGTGQSRAQWAKAHGPNGSGPWARTWAHPLGGDDGDDGDHDDDGRISQPHPAPIPSRPGIQ